MEAAFGLSHHHHSPKPSRLFTPAGKKVLFPGNRHSVSFRRPQHFPVGRVLRSLTEPAGHRGQPLPYTLAALPDEEMKGREGDKGRGRVGVGVGVGVGATLALSCVLGLGTLFLGHPTCLPADAFCLPPRAAAALASPVRDVPRSMSPSDTWRRLQVARSTFLNPDWVQTKMAGARRNQPTQEVLNQLKAVVFQQMEIGMIEEAVSLVRECCRIYDDMPEEKNYFRMLLVEMLIYQGRFDEANQLCKEELPKPEEDAARIHALPLLYKAVLSVMLSSGDAEDCWEKFRDFVEENLDLPDDLPEFKKFNKSMNRLKEVIEANKEQNPSSARTV